MYQNYLPTINAHIIVDDDNNIREVLHRDKPVKIEMPTVQLVSQQYLQQNQSLFNLLPTQLQNLSLSPETHPIDAGIEYRILGEKHFFKMSTAAYQQTYFGLPVWGRGISLNIKHGPFRILSSSNSSDDQVQATKPSVSALRKFRKVSIKELINVLHLDDGDNDAVIDNKSLRINSERLVVYQFFRERALAHEHPRPSRTSSHVSHDILSEYTSTDGPKFQHAHPRLPVAIGGEGIEEGSYYV